MKRLALTLAALIAFAVPAFGQQKPVNIGSSANNANGDPPRTAFGKLNDNDADLYARLSTIGRFAPVIDGNGKLSFQRGPTIGTYQNGQFTSQPYSLQIGAGGATGPVDGASVTPNGGVTRLLSAIISDSRTAESFGAKGDGTTDDTVAFQAISTWMGAAPGRGVVLRTGAVYMVKNFVWPFQQGNALTAAGPSEVRALPGGDADYFVATSRYVSNNAYLDYPIYTRNITFNANGIKNKAFVVQTYFSKFENTLANNATQDGWFVGAVTQNGTAVNGTGVENKWIESGATGNGRHGIYNTQYTDGWIIGGTWHDNGGTNGSNGWNIYLGQSAGWFGSNIHGYNVVSGPGSQDIYLGNFGYASTITNNYFEGIVNVASLEASSKSATLGPGNTIMGGLNALIANSGPTTLTSLANTYKTATGQIRHQYFSADHLVISKADTFDTATPFTWSNGASTGLIRADRSWSQGLLGTLDGLYGPSTPLVIGRVNIPLSTPSSSSAACTAGDRAADANYEYVCTAANTWKRAALSPF